MGIRWEAAATIAFRLNRTAAATIGFWGNFMGANETERERELEEALESMLRQFAYRVVRYDGLFLGTYGLSALEDAFDALGWNDPFPIPESECEADGCHKEGTCGTPHVVYVWTCFEHRLK